MTIDTTQATNNLESFMAGAAQVEADLSHGDGTINAEVGRKMLGDIRGINRFLDSLIVR